MAPRRANIVQADTHHLLSRRARLTVDLGRNALIADRQAVRYRLRLRGVWTPFMLVVPHRWPAHE